MFAEHAALPRPLPSSSPHLPYHPGLLLLSALRSLPLYGRPLCGDRRICEFAKSPSPARLCSAASVSCRTDAKPVSKRDEDGRPYVLGSVLKAEDILHKQRSDKEYLPITVSLPILDVLPTSVIDYCLGCWRFHQARLGARIREGQ